MLARYARLAVRVGLNLRAGQRLIINNPSTRGVPLHAAPLVREITRAAYEAGARYVDVIWNDLSLLRIRSQLAPRDSAREYPTWHIQGMMDMVEHGDALLTIRSNDPDLLSDLDPEFVGEWQKVHYENFDPVSKAAQSNRMNWCVIAAANPDWAHRIWPKLPPREAEAKLWTAIFEITRLDQADPVQAWENHISDLKKRADFLTEKHYTHIRYRAPGTNLEIGLPDGHCWLAAREDAENGIDFCANLPTEEAFTLPHCDKVNGTVSASLPLSYAGILIKDFTLKFEAGRITHAHAKSGEAILKKMIAADEGASRLGELALVPQSSPIARKKILFYDPLIDENASSHLAVGSAYRSCLDNTLDLSDEDFRSRGGNVSITHVDFMIGSNKMDIDGIHANGTAEPIMRKGDWAIPL